MNFEETKFDPNGDVPPPLPKELEKPAVNSGRAKKEAPKTESVLQEREFAAPENLSAKEASKKIMMEEREALALEIRKERNENKDKISELKVRLDLLRLGLSAAEANWESGQKKYEELAESRDRQANSFAGRIKRGLGIEFAKDRLLEGEVKSAQANIESAITDKQILDQEIKSLEDLLESDKSLDAIKEKLSAHYTKAEKISQEQFEKQQKTVESSAIRNNAFILHTLTTNERFRHNENSPVSQAATIEDDLDLLLSLEPSISTSSVKPGEIRSLFQESAGNIGVIIGGGEIKSADSTDVGTKTSGIMGRAEKDSSSDQIDKVINDGYSGYNEIVVNNPKVFGLFKSVRRMEDGSLNLNESDSVSNFKIHLEMARAKGLPQFLLTNDRKLFEFINIEDSGKIIAGKEISPEEVAMGKAGLSTEDRKTIGSEVISKYLFRDPAAQLEAKKIVGGLEGSQDLQLSREELILQLAKYPEEFESRLIRYPKPLLSDKSFMLEAAGLNPEAVLRTAGRYIKELAFDGDFIKSVYSMIPAGGKEKFVLASLPKEALNRELIFMAIDRNENFGGGVLTQELFDDPEIKRVLIRKEIDSFNISPFDRERVVDAAPSFSFRNSEGKLALYSLKDDEAFMDGIRRKYEGQYKIEPYYDDLLVTKL